MKKQIIRGRKALCRAAMWPICCMWSPFSRLILLSDFGGQWSLDWDMIELRRIARRIGIRTKGNLYQRNSRKQCVFAPSRQFLEDECWLTSTHRYAISYFHGKPGTCNGIFDLSYEKLSKNHNRLSRVHISHSEMKDIILESGIAREKVFQIPIGVNLSFFKPQTVESRKAARLQYNIPDSAIVIGSFQKDGVGWGDGREPKLVKGPDVFLKVIEILKSRITELWVFLSGPARGYVKAGLEALGVPYTHHYAKEYPEVGEMFQAIDLYIVTSRQEGGPKAVLESMASRVPLVTTKVGQAMDLVKHGENGWMVDVEDAVSLAHWALYALEHQESQKNILENGLIVAQQNSYESLTERWGEFMDGFVEFSER